MGEKRGVVWIAEEDDFESGTLVFLGTFWAHHDDGGIADELHGASADEAIAWGRRRAHEVWIRMADSDYYAAGDRHASDAPRWPPPALPRRRRPKGQEWRDRTKFDPPIPWLVEVRTNPPSGTAVTEGVAIVADAAERARAVRWYRGDLDVDLEQRALLPANSPPREVKSFEPVEYVVEVVVTRPTAEQAMREARELCDFPDEWTPYCLAQPAGPAETRSPAAD